MNFLLSIRKAFGLAILMIFALIIDGLIRQIQTSF